MDFVTASSNLRARSYSIPEADKHTTRGIAGKIMPALVTTTALVAGLASLELLKLAQGKTEIEQYRYTFLHTHILYYTLRHFHIITYPPSKPKIHIHFYTIFTHSYLYIFNFPYTPKVHADTNPLSPFLWFHFISHTRAHTQQCVCKYGFALLWILGAGGPARRSHQ